MNNLSFLTLKLSLLVSSYLQGEKEEGQDRLLNMKS